MKWKNALKGRCSIVTASHDHEDQDECNELGNSGDDFTDDECADFVPMNNDENSDGKRRYIITANNLDKNIKPRFMTVDHQIQSLHCFHSFAALNHISSADLSEDVPTSRFLRGLSASAFLPSLGDCQKLCENYIILVVWAMYKNLKAFSSFQDYVPKHILHQHSNAMAKKSVTVSR